MDFSKFFITICTKKRQCIFAKDACDPFVLSTEGKIAKKCWLEIPNHFSHVEIDEFVVMPNHIHGILVFKKKNGYT